MHGNNRNLMSNVLVITSNICIGNRIRKCQLFGIFVVFPFFHSFLFLTNIKDSIYGQKMFCLHLYISLNVFCPFSTINTLSKIFVFFCINIIEPCLSFNLLLWRKKTFGINKIHAHTITKSWKLVKCVINQMKSLQVKEYHQTKLDNASFAWKKDTF